MTLREKFKDVLINPIWQMTMIDKQMQITDEFAIEFAEWCDDLGYVKFPDLWICLEDESGKTSKELLEIFKKEKGL